MLLSAAGERPFENMRGTRKGRGNVATLDAPRWTDELLPSNYLFDRENGRQRIQFDAHGGLGGLQRWLARAGQEDDRLADVVAHGFRQQLFIMEDRAKGVCCR